MSPASGEPPRRGPRPGGSRPSAIDPRIRQRRTAVARREGRRRLGVVLAIIAVVVVVAGGFALLHTPIFAVRSPVVVGSHPHTPTADVIAAAGLAAHPPLIDVNAGGSTAKIEALPWIATATVERHWPSGVTITVTERTPIATMAGPSSSWSEIDRTGRTVQVDPARPGGMPVLVVYDAHGPVPPAALGHSLPAAAAPALRVASSLPKAFSAQVVAVTGRADGTVDLALDSGLTVLLGTTADLHAKYVDVAAIIAGAPLRGAKTIDVTVPQAPTVS